MIHAYSDVYIDLAQQNLGSMLDHAANDLGFDIDEFFSFFIASGIARSFGRGDYRYISGMSGAELANAVLDAAGLQNRARPLCIRLDRTREFWTGWVIAYYQWWSALSFAEIIMHIKPSGIILLYHPYHEMDIMQICARLDGICRRDTRLRNWRVAMGQSQSQLSSKAGVPVRTIQQYEQRVRDINKAQAGTVARLAFALGVESAFLLEND